MNLPASGIVYRTAVHCSSGSGIFVNNINANVMSLSDMFLSESLHWLSSAFAKLSPTVVAPTAAVSRERGQLRAQNAFLAAQDLNTCECGELTAAYVTHADTHADL